MYRTYIYIITNSRYSPSASPPIQSSTHTPHSSRPRPSRAHGTPLGNREEPPGPQRVPHQQRVDKKKRSKTPFSPCSEDSPQVGVMPKWPPQTGESGGARQPGPGMRQLPLPYHSQPWTQEIRGWDRTEWRVRRRMGRPFRYIVRQNQRMHGFSRG
jgi:hypothetical protein